MLLQFYYELEQKWTLYQSFFVKGILKNDNFEVFWHFFIESTTYCTFHEKNGNFCFCLIDHETFYSFSFSKCTLKQLFNSFLQ